MAKKQGNLAVVVNNTGSEAPKKKSGKKKKSDDVEAAMQAERAESPTGETAAEKAMRIGDEQGDPSVMKTPLSNTDDDAFEKAMREAEEAAKRAEQPQPEPKAEVSAAEALYKAEKATTAHAYGLVSAWELAKREGKDEKGREEAVRTVLALYENNSVKRGALKIALTKILSASAGTPLHTLLRKLTDEVPSGGRSSGGGGGGTKATSEEREVKVRWTGKNGEGTPYVCAVLPPWMRKGTKTLRLVPDEKNGRLYIELPTSK